MHYLVIAEEGETTEGQVYPNIPIKEFNTLPTLSEVWYSVAHLLPQSACISQWNSDNTLTITSRYGNTTKIAWIVID